ncbi:MAG: serine hydrolase, partial [Gammaproteobacteria bacterium]|nr:serine hydrolase [Gammaproteobacteria bacterium]
MLRFILLIVLCLGINGLALAKSGQPLVESQFALVLDAKGRTLFSKNADTATSIASITKLMTAMVVLDAGQSMDEILSITQEDRDRLKNTSSRLGFGARLSREKMLTIALSSSENRAAHALARYYPGGVPAFVKAMNRKARSLGMNQTRFADPTGLSPKNVSTARDLARLTKAAMGYARLRQASISKRNLVYPFKNKTPLEYRVTNSFVRNDNP